MQLKINKTYLTAHKTIKKITKQFIKIFMFSQFEFSLRIQITQAKIKNVKTTF